MLDLKNIGAFLQIGEKIQLDELYSGIPGLSCSLEFMQDNPISSHPIN